MTKPTPLTIEVCVNSLESALAAERGGADRVELCDNLFEGGTTPSAATIELAVRELGIPANVIVRPRGGDFCYSRLEFASVLRDIEVAKGFGAAGVVLGMLREDGRVDAARTAEAIAAARPLPVTFHRAFDMAADPYEALDQLIDLGVERLLTSGQEASVPEGLDLIADLVERAGGRIVVMPGGGVREHNIAKVVARTGVREIHVSGLAPVESRMTYRNSRVFMGGALRPPEFTVSVTDPGRIRRFRAAAAGG